MNLAWCMIGLALASGDDPKSATSPPATASFKIEIKISGPALQPQISSTVAKQATTRDPALRPAAAFPADPPAGMPAAAKPAAVDDPTAVELWPMLLPHAIRIGLDNSEIVRVIAFGAQGIPIGGFDPPPDDSSARGKNAGDRAAGTPTGAQLARRRARNPASPRAGSSRGMRS